MGSPDESINRTESKPEGMIQFSAYMFGFLMGGLWSLHLAPRLVSGSEYQRAEAAFIIAVIVVFALFPFLIGWLGQWKNKTTQTIAKILAGGAGAGLLNLVFAVAHAAEANIALVLTICASLVFGGHLIFYLWKKK